MKIYEFKCEDCGSIFELLKDESVKLSCQACGSVNIKRIFSTPILVKEHVKYDGKTCCGRDERCSAPPCGENGNCVR